ncbi:3-dehydroquinate synthase [Streptomyces capparidis]
MLTENGTPRPAHGLFTTGRPVSGWTVSAARTVSYEVRLCPGVLDPANPALATAGQPGSPRRLLVVEARVDELYGRAIRAYCRARDLDSEVLVLPAHERLKTMDSVCRVTEAMDSFGVDRRREPVIAVGGGVLLDIVGLACGLYRRSTPYVRVPTTLIGLVDAGVGVKTGVNSGSHKNRLGTYHAASTTLLDPAFLATLDDRHVSNGLAEILKIALVLDQRLFELLERDAERLVRHRMREEPGSSATEVLARAVHGMLAELQPNLWEHGLERVVDYGHTFSPTIEMRSFTPGSGPALLHGEAVCVDMALTTVLAWRRGLIGVRQRDRVLSVMRRLRLPVTHPLCRPDVLADALADTVRHRDGEQRLPLPLGIGDACFVNDVTGGELERAAEFLRSREDRRA